MRLELELERNTTYEVRISYLGTVGASFKIDWDPECKPKIPRKLLDTEKLIFSTDEFGTVIQNNCERSSIIVTATRDSRAVNEEAFS